MAAPAWPSAQHRIFLAGPPGAGKGTVAAQLERHLGVVAISTGDLCREEIARDSEVGRAIKARVEAGVIRVETRHWLPALLARLEAAPAAGWILDGAPRWREQVAELQLVQVTPTLFIILDLSEEECLRRLSTRLIHKPSGQVYNALTNPPPPELLSQCAPRADDQSGKAIARVRESNQWFADVDTWYPSDVVVRINADQSVDQVLSDILKAVNSLC
ncbi:MAG: nucleoside monophosphate kinase [archaeon]|nr:nucleoside monophosphate kinase [archaeon]